jgi:flagellar protein FliO/FliZ
LGGEKLKKSRHKIFYIFHNLLSPGAVRFFAAALVIAAGLGAVFLPPLSAQDLDTGAEAAAVSPEDSIILGEDSPAIPLAAPGASVSLILRMLLVLLLAAAAIYGVVYFLKRSSRPPEQRDPNVKLLSAVHLGASRFVYVVSVGPRAWLLGGGGDGVNLIAEIEDPDTVNAMLLEESRRSARGLSGKFPDFKGLLRRLGLPVEGHLPGADNIRKRRERLKGFK